MKIEDFVQQYPNLYQVLDELGGDNGMTMRHYLQFPPSEDLEKLEQQACRLSPEEKEILAAGEFTEQLEVVRRQSVAVLHEFLCECFDGYLRHVVFEDE